MISLDGHGGGCVRTLLSGLLSLCGIGVCAPDFDGPSWNGAEQELLQRTGALRRRAHVDRWSRGRSSLALCVATAARQAATILATDDVDHGSHGKSTYYTPGAGRAQVPVPVLPVRAGGPYLSVLILNEPAPGPYQYRE